ncbi:immunity 22 family protein [Inconstantimicrobium mannanitabidum]|uniref:Uncharacterized protein n=1 Tax=Inconstantimicrobium mannanitabidum TaxID=1604901 RepID=A0ACB5R9S4_9CLOT|nr:immunity 22 family protein [Clostridium sp. TW13]GKX65860.1 hypothetical protein rsdtw13_11180 [Clostridium sp. TW13]
MESKGQVSIWVGNFSEFKELERYVESGYTEDGDSVDSKFEADFGIEYYDEDFREINMFEEPQESFTCMLQEHSYYNSIIKNYTKEQNDCLGTKYNSIILLYNFNYNKNVKEIQESDRYIKYIGSVEYDEMDY